MRDDTRNRIRVAHLIYSPRVGGSEMLAAEICGRLDRSLFDPVCLMLFPGCGQMPDILKNRAVRTSNLNRSRTTRIFGPLLPALRLRRLKIDILHVHHVPFFLTILKPARLAGIGHICLTEHDWLSISKSRKLQQGCRLAALQAGFFSVVSQNLKDFLVREVSVAGSRIAVIPNGVDTSRFSPGRPDKAIRELTPEGFSGKVIMSVGRLAEEKDYPNLLCALDRVRKTGRHDFHLVLVGDGALRLSLESQTRASGLWNWVSFAGPRTDVARLLPGADMFVMSSKSEGLPISILEAMACGLPVISTHVGGICELVENGSSGLLVPPGNPDALAAAICKVLGDAPLARQLGQAARKRVEAHFSSDNMMRDYSNLYLDLVKGGNKPFKHGDGTLPLQARLAARRSEPGSGEVGCMGWGKTFPCAFRARFLDKSSTRLRIGRATMNPEL